MNAWCAEWGSRIKFFFSELYFRTWCGNSGRIAADFYLHPSEIPDAFMVLHCALLPLDVPEGEARAHKPQREEGPERLLPAQEGETQVGELIVGLHITNISDLASEIYLRLTYLPPFPSR